MFLDQNNYFVDKTGDGGDSARSSGVFSCLKPPGVPGDPKIANYHRGYKFVRHPYQETWNNPNNFTRDQLICLIAGLASYSRGYINLLRGGFWAHAKRCFFCQNIERDKRGSRKHLWPHEFYRDSRPSSLTVLKRFDWNTFKFISGGFLFFSKDDGYEVESRVMDYRDPLMPHHIWHFILCARIYWLYWFGILGIPLLILSLVFNSSGIDSEQNQLQCMAKIQGRWAVWLYKKCNPKWRDQTRQYWESRDEKFMSDRIIATLEANGSN